MKAKVIITLLVCAVVTLSFTFSSAHKPAAKGKVAASDATASSNELSGGLGSVDPLK